MNINTLKNYFYRKIDWIKDKTSHRILKLEVYMNKINYEFVRNKLKL